MTLGKAGECRCPVCGSIRVFGFLNGHRIACLICAWIDGTGKSPMRTAQMQNDPYREVGMDQPQLLRTKRANPLQMVGPWQPIETAPKDFRRILLYSPKEGVGSGFWQHIRTGEPYDNAWTDVFGWHFYGCLIQEGDCDMPTHWMPMPDGPHPTPDEEDTRR